MVMLSDLLRIRLEDASGTRPRLIDFAVDTAVGDYPPVTRVVFRGDDGARQLPWDAFTADWRRCRLRGKSAVGSHPA